MVAINLDLLDPPTCPILRLPLPKNHPNRRVSWWVVSLAVELRHRSHRVLSSLDTLHRRLPDSRENSSFLRSWTTQSRTCPCLLLHKTRVQIDQSSLDHCLRRGKKVGRSSKFQSSRSMLNRRRLAREGKIWSTSWKCSKRFDRAVEIQLGKVMVER